MIVFTASLRFDDVTKINYVCIECDKVANYFLLLSYVLSVTASYHIFAFISQYIYDLTLDQSEIDCTFRYLFRK